MFDRGVDVRAKPMEWRTVRELFLKLLVQAQSHRGEMQELIRHGAETVPAWHLFELKAMLKAVNMEREKRGLPAVAMEEVVRVNQYATGHCDYTTKFALYCAELGVGQDPRL